MKKHILLFSLLASSVAATAQTDVTLPGYPTCGFNQALQKVHVTHAQLIEGYKKTAAKTTTDTAIYDIPVVFHIVYYQPAGNLPDSIIYNQVAVLNSAFRNMHADTANTRPFFKPIAADTRIQFHLATTDPNGNPTNGITRTHTDHTHFGSSLSTGLDSFERVKSTAAGGIDPWPTDRYLNIWVANLADESGALSVLGYGLPPLHPLPPNWDPADSAVLTGIIDGVVLQPHAVGSNNPLSSALMGLYTKGRAMVHEVGHYLGLQHVFGGTDGSSSTACGTAIQSDGIDDTPEQSTLSFTTGCPSPTKNSCGSGPTDSVDLWEDYMDYTTDACQTLFTKDQATIMRNVLGNQRITLTNPPALVNNITTLSPNALYPNPATSHITVAYTGVIAKATIISFTGQVVLQLDNDIANSKNYDISNLASGNYLLLIRDANGRQLTGRFAVVNK